MKYKYFTFNFQIWKKENCEKSINQEKIKSCLKQIITSQWTNIEKFEINLNEGRRKFKIEYILCYILMSQSIKYEVTL